MATTTSVSTINRNKREREREKEERTEVIYLFSPFLSGRHELVRAPKCPPPLPTPPSGFINYFILTVTFPVYLVVSRERKGRKKE